MAKIVQGDATAYLISQQAFVWLPNPISHFPAPDRLRSAREPDQSLHCPPEEGMGPWLPTEPQVKTDKTVHY